MQQDYQAFLQRQVAIGVGVASVLLALIGFARRVLFYNQATVQAIIYPGVGLVVLVGFLFLATTIRSGHFGRVVQVTVSFVVACSNALDADSGDLTSSVFLVASMMLASEYGIFSKRPRLLIGAPLAIFVAAFFYGIYHKTGAVLATVHTLLGAGLVAFLFVAIIRTRLDQVRDREVELESVVAQRTEGLRREVVRRARLEDDLRKSAIQSERLASERALLLHELHHRTKNDLQLLASMIRLHGEEEPGSTKRDVLGVAEDRIMAIALVHEHLYAADELSAISLENYLDGLIAHLRSAHSGSKVTIKQELSTCIKVGIEPAIHLGLAINELVQNARKHAFPDGKDGTVVISAHDVEDGLEVAVKDDGIGIRGADRILGSDSVGIEIVRGLVEQLEGRISLEAGDQTCWRLWLPAQTLTAAAPSRSGE